MESTLFTVLSTNEEANLSGGGNANGGNGGRGGRGGRGGDSTATGGVFIDGTTGAINGSPIAGGTTGSAAGGAGAAGGIGGVGGAGGTSNG
ncbi:hypothetical protein ANSO36C_36910 [Nostoc cf. commune SO-36]|uniref:PE-PGRS family protein n=1 Tax=Nostoc cf. commune SO-36 TaxID=449208 RepID=A0ABM7Z4C7_NOSCO|nr:hypothetical protein [Nostoc commune]BDI17889.1 hypothetical protein ANSO36C_36910 [Nostoc cf. commune SO-36]